MRLCVPWHQQRRACPSHVHSHITWRPAWSLAIGTQTLSYPSASLSSPCPASTTAPGVQHSSVLAVFASIAANDILLAKVQNLPVHSCRSQAEPSREWARRWTPTVHFPTPPLPTAHSPVLLATRTMPGCHYRSRLALLQVALLALGICNYSRLD